MDKHYRVLALSGLLLLNVVCSKEIVAANKCVNVAGTVSLKPEPDNTCTVTEFFPVSSAGPKFLALAGTCFSVQLDGVLKGSGHVGFTVEKVRDLYGGESTTPLFVQEAGVSETRQFFTARSALDVQRISGLPGPGCRLFTRDAGVIDITGNSAEQLIITGGEKRCTKASGILFATGTLIEPGKGLYRGTLCLN